MDYTTEVCCLLTDYCAEKKGNQQKSGTVETEYDGDKHTYQHAHNNLVDCPSSAIQYNF